MLCAVKKKEIKMAQEMNERIGELEENIRKIVTNACASVWKDTINDLSAKGSIQRSINYAMREIKKLLEVE